MLTEKRQEEIYKLVQANGSVTVQELRDMFDASESTIRRDLNSMDSKGLLTKVFGGAVRIEKLVDSVKEEAVSFRNELHRDEKIQIARYAASLIEKDDFVYLDAGTTIGNMIPFITEQSVSFVTNAVSHALLLAEKGYKVTLIGGEVKAATEAIVGNDAYVNLQKYNFTKGFFGTNAVNMINGFTTPDSNEASIKEYAIKHSRKAYVLCDNSKFGLISPVKFADFDDVHIISDSGISDKYKMCNNVTTVNSNII